MRHNYADLPERVVIIGSCQSGSFIPALSKAGRVIITGGTADEDTYRGILEPDGIRGGEFFVDELINYFARGLSLKESFKLSSESTKIFIDDYQHPLLDDNGDGEGSNTLSNLYGDGFLADSLHSGPWLIYNQQYQPCSYYNYLPEITDVNDTVFLNPYQTTADVWIKANKMSEFVMANGKNMTFNRNPLFSRWEKSLNGFNEPGKYYIDYFSFNAVSPACSLVYPEPQTAPYRISPLKYSLVYKDKVGNNAPYGFNLLSPIGSTQKTVLILNWERAFDPDGDSVTYTVQIAADFSFNNVVYRKTDIPSGILFIGAEAGLQDHTLYYWKVEAVDAFGRRTSSETQSFYTNNAGGLPTTFEGYVRLLHPSSPVSVSFYPTIQEAYNNSFSGDIIQVPAVPLTGDLSFNRSISVAVEGGYNSDFTSFSGGFTSLKGSITTSAGSVAMKNIVLEK